MKKVFLDTDIILDFLAQREPHYNAAAELFSMISEGKIKAHTTTQSFANLAYLLTKAIAKEKVSRVLLKTSKLFTVIPVSASALDKAFMSNFTDLEDAMQYYAALEHKITAIITRNKKDYKHSQIQVFNASEFIAAIGFDCAGE